MFDMRKSRRFPQHSLRSALLRVQRRDAKQSAPTAACTFGVIIAVDAFSSVAMELLLRRAVLQMRWLYLGKITLLFL
jgi:hypothetical protein